MDATRFAGRVAVVTAAAAGIGAATAARLADEGAQVIVTDVDGPGASAVAATIRDRGGAATALPLDVTSAADWAALRRYVDEHHDRLDVLHSNAGRAIVKAAHDLDQHEWDAQLAVSLTGAWLGTRALVDLLGRSRGAIVLTSSVHALVGLPGHPAYAAAKGALCALGRQLAVEYGPDVRVNTVLPGPVLTAAWDGVGEVDRATSIAGTVAKRFGEPAEIAAAVAFLASPDASFVTGATLVVDGGWSIMKDSA